MRNSKPLNIIAAGAAGVALLFGAWAVGKSAPDSTASARQAGQPGAIAQGGAQGAPPGMGTNVTGATADKVEKAALAKYPGTIERVVQLPDGSYVAHVITDDGELHVAVSKTFAVTGTSQGPANGQRPPGQAPAGQAASSAA